MADTTERNSETLERVKGDILPPTATDPDDLLPPSICDDIEGILLEFSSKYNIDLANCANLQWRAACLEVGRYIQASGILLDMEKLRQRGGNKYYKAEVVAALLPIWERFTMIYKHVPLTSDFIAFTGISREWFYDTRGVLTSSRVDIIKKARSIEESALGSALVDSRENPTGRIYYTKARLGWQETTTVQHVSVAAAAAPAALPVFGENTHKLEETRSNETENGED